MIPAIPIGWSARALLFLLFAAITVGSAAAQTPLDPLQQAYEAGMRAFHADDLETAAKHFEKALAIARERYGADDPRIATDLNNLAEVYRLLGRFADAEKLYLEALELDRRRPVGNPSETATTLNNLALLYRAQKRFDEAEELYRRALRLLEESVGPNHQDVARLLNNWAMLKLAADDPAAALELERRAVEVAKKALSPDHPSIRVLEANLERIRSALATARTASPSGQGKETAVAAGAAAPAPAAGPAAGGFAVHLASLGSKEAALEAAEKLRAKHVFLADVGSVPPQPVEIEGRGTFWRVLFGPFPSRREAAELCAKAKAEGADCFVRELGG